MSTPDHLYTTIDKYFDEKINTFGHGVVMTADLHTTFVYSVGLVESYDHPEFIICSRVVPLKTCQSLINRFAGLVQSGTVFTDRVSCSVVLDRGLPVGVHRISKQNRDLYLKVARSRYQALPFSNSWTAFQLVLPDSYGLLPWNDQCSDWWIQKNMVIQ